MKKIFLFVGIIFSILASMSAVAIPLVIKYFIDNAEINFSIMNLMLLLSLFILQGILTGLGGYFLSVFGENYVKDLRMKMVNKLIYAPLLYFDRKDTGDIVSLVVNHSQEIRTFISDNISRIITDSLIIILSVIILFMLDFQLTLSMLIIFPVLMILLIPISKLFYNASESYQNSISKLTNRFISIFNKMLFIKTNNAENESADFLNEAINHNYKDAKRINLIKHISNPLIITFLFAAISFIFSYGGYRVSTNEITIGTLISFLVFTLQLLNPIGGISNHISAYSTMKGALDHINEIFNMSVENFDDGVELIPGEIEIANLSFGYDDELDIHNLSLSIEQGMKVALVGPSGSGKSTIAKLILGLYPIQSGDIKINSQSITEIKLGSLRKSFSYVSQTPTLLNQSIKDNLLFGLNEIPSDQEIIESLRKASISKEELENFPEGLNTIVGEDGKLLSGGQKQRITIAKAYLRHTPYVILDEVTSNLDAENEMNIIDYINHDLDLTYIIIAHRLSTIKNCDKILFVDDGYLTGVGTHYELYNNHEAYRGFVDNQTL